ncbi:hypothetical protein F4779DRAFT_452049 [Xylariaceae sp. FL0662B]|nr:hypothetical protein F4779DRAFT_452049 [Xylariaceae sp. FL0662B]
MGISSRIDRSIYGAILNSRPSPRLSSTTLAHATGAHNACRKSMQNAFLSGACCSWTTRPKSMPKDSSIFIFSRHITSTIATAGRRVLSPSYLGGPHSSCRRSWNHTAADVAKTEDPPPDIVPSKNALLDFVIQYDDTSVEEHLEYLRDPYLRRYAPADGPKLTVSEKDEEIRLESISRACRRSRDEWEMIWSLHKAMRLKLKHPGTVSLDTIWDLYQELPDPRISSLGYQLRHRLLAVLGMAERKDSKSMLRYFSVVADVKNCGFSLTRREWNTAMSFASRYVGTSTETEVEAALHLWREMEQAAGIRASDVTFNIIFDVASKAGKFSLAEMIYQEMNTRGFSFSRYHHVSLIHFFGLKLNTDGVRAAYKEMVELGEIIDTIVLNCVISSFLRAGEEDSAFRVYEKMKTSIEGSTLTPDRNYTLQKSITKVLMMFARIGKKYPDMRPNFQQAALVSPDLQTYRILVNHYGTKIGDLTKVAQFLDEMKLYNVPLHGAIFLSIFKGFAKYGGVASDWSEQRLSSVWEAFLDALDSRTDGLYISTWMAMSILDAFARYSSREQMLDIYESMRCRWNLDMESSHFMLDYLNRCLQKKDWAGQFTQRMASAMRS